MTKDQLIKFVKAVMKSEDMSSALHYLTKDVRSCNRQQWMLGKRKSYINKEPIIVNKKKK